MDPSASPEQDINGKEKASVGVVKDMETGKEFSILEFENAMGVRMTSPIMREVDRRARERGEQSEVVLKAKMLLHNIDQLKERSFVIFAKQDDENQDEDALSDNDGAQKKARVTSKKTKSKGKWMAKRMKNVVKFIAGDKNKASQKAEDKTSTETPPSAETINSELSKASEEVADHANSNGALEEVH